MLGLPLGDTDTEQEAVGTTVPKDLSIEQEAFVPPFTPLQFHLYWVEVSVTFAYIPASHFSGTVVEQTPFSTPEGVGKSALVE